MKGITNQSEFSPWLPWSLRHIKLEMKLTDAAIRGVDRNTIRTVITLSTLFTVYTSCVMLERNKRHLEGRILEKCYSCREITLSYTTVMSKSPKEKKKKALILTLNLQDLPQNPGLNSRIFFPSKRKWGEAPRTGQPRFSPPLLNEAPDIWRSKTQEDHSSKFHSVTMNG